MKIKLPLFALLLGFLLNANAQHPITLTDADMPRAGFNPSSAKDTPTVSVNYGSAGANQVYDFSSLTNTRTQSATYAGPTGSQLAAYSNPLANLTVQSSGSSAYLILDTSASKYQIIGAQGTVFGVFTSSHFSPAEDVYHFPMTYQSSFHSNWGFYQAFTGAQVGQGFPVDSVREVYTDHFSVTADGWGKVITPVSSYRGLRLKRVDTTVANIDAYYFGSWSNQSSTTNYTTEYSYVAKETKGAVVSFDYDSAGNMKDAVYSLIPPAAPTAGFTFATGSAGLVNLTDTSVGYPTRYHWNFGDGDTSNVVNPSHTYAANGTYYVCETVYNGTGNSTVCDSVHVTNVIVHQRPIALNDTATVHQPNYDTVTVTANDHSPSNDAFCVTAIYGGTYFSVLNCNNIAFSPTAGFTGLDSCHYIICNTGQPTLCDTGVLVIDVIPSSTHIRPVAVNDTAIDIENHTDVISVTGNDNSPSGDPFCITRVYGSADFTVQGCNNLSFAPPNNYVGYDTAWYIVCNTGQPTLCDTARVIVDVVAQHLPPVAVADVSTVLQPNSANINVTGNDHSPSYDPFCITTVYGSAYFSVLDCNNLTFTPDSTFTGNDTAWYIECNTGQPTLCDTASIIVTVNPNSALWPAADFNLVSANCDMVVVANTSLNADSLVWSFHTDFSQNSNLTPDDTTVYSRDTVYYGQIAPNVIGVEFCVVAYNRFGHTVKCDSITTICEGITEIQLSGVHLYPNPTSSQLTVDMRDNTDAITKNYSAIEIYNVVGQKVKSINKTGHGDVVSIPVAQLPGGIYLATIVDSNGAKSVLGKFTVIQ